MRFSTFPGERPRRRWWYALHGLPGEERNQDLAQVLRRAGYAVLLPHYRGAWGSAGIFSFRHCLSSDIDAMLRWLDDPGVRRRFSLDAQPRALVEPLHGAIWRFAPAQGTLG